MSILAIACSVFATLIGTDAVVGKNFDWSDGRGFLVVNARDRVRQPFSGEGASWTSRFGSVSLTVLGPGLPVSGMNEAGLVFEALVDQDAPAVTGERHELTSLEWGQYVLDRFETIEDVVRSVKERGVRQLALPLHFFVCDRNGGCAVVEPRESEVRVISKKSLSAKVLANASWGDDAAAARDYLGENPISRFFTANAHSHVRFARLARAVRDGEIADRTTAFEALDEARIRRMNRWQLLWNQAKRTLDVRLRDDDGAAAMRAEVQLSSQDFGCKAAPQIATLAPRPGKLRLRPYGEKDVDAVERRFGAMLGGGARLRELALRIGAYTISSRCAMLGE